MVLKKKVSGQSITIRSSDDLKNLDVGYYKVRILLYTSIFVYYELVEPKFCIVDKRIRIV